jgi:hypothetical protein
VKTIKLMPVVRRWRLIAAVVGVGALVGGGGLFAASADSSAAQAFHGVTTVRVLDTREGLGSPLGPRGLLDVVIPGLPDYATAVAVNLTVVDGTEGSFLTLYPTGDPRPITSSINWLSSAAVANSATVQVGATHSVRIYNLKGTVNVVVDLIGYYAPAPLGGPIGPQGPSGVNGTNGINGINGVNGLPGVTGATGTSSGPAGSVYAYASNAVAEPVDLGNAVRFSTAGPSNPAGPNGIAFTAPGSTFAIPTTGVYKVTFSVISTDDNQLSVRVNGVTPSSGAYVFGAELHQPNVGTAILALVRADVVTIINSTTGSLAGTINLDGSIGGTSAAINAWIMIEQLNG